jgi:hypothetical protein
MTQAQGSLSRLVITEEITYKTAPQLTLEDCEDAWNEQVVGNVTSTLDAADFKVGSGSAKFDIAAGASSGIVGSEAINIASLASYTHVAMWIKSTVDLAANDFQLLLDNTANCASPLETLNIPAIVANTWTQVRMALANSSTDLTLISIGLKMAVDKGALVVNVDDVRAITEGHYVPFLSESIRQSRDLTSSQIIRSTRNPGKPTRRKYALSGDITTELDPYMGLLLKHLFGGYVRTGGPQYTHTFKIGTLPTGLQLEKQFTDIPAYIRQSGLKVKSMKCEVKEEGEIATTFGFAGAKEAIASPALPFDGQPTDYGHNPFDAYEATVAQGGAGLTGCTLQNFTIDNQLDEGAPRPIGSAGELASLPSGIVKVEGQVTIIFENTTLYAIALAGTETTIVVTLTKGSGAGTAGNEKLTFTFNEVVFKPQTPVITGPKGVLAELPFVAYYDNDAGASALIAELINPQATL